MGGLGFIVWDDLIDSKDPDLKPGKAITASRYLQRQMLNDGDALYVPDGIEHYEKWTLGAADGSAVPAWSPVVTVYSNGSGDTVAAEASDVETREIVRGGSTLVERETRTTPFFLVGQYCGEDVVVRVAAGTAAAPVSSVITNPNLGDLDVNSIGWGSNPTADDRIQIPTDGSIPLTLRWKNGKWGQTVVDPMKRKSVWKTEFSVKPGTGRR